MVRTIIYAVYLIALIGATLLIILRADSHWDAHRKIKKNLISCEDEEQRAKHKYAFTNATVDAISWTAIAIGSVYACFDCLVSLLNTL